MKKMIYRQGNVLTRTGQPSLLIHICNNRGGFGAGFAKALAARYPQVKEAYRAWVAGDSQSAHFTAEYFRLGNIQAVGVGDALTIINMIAQNGYKSEDNQQPIDYTALQKCLVKVRAAALREKRLIILPKIGTGLAGGDWQIIERLITENLCQFGIEVVCFELSKS